MTTSNKFGAGPSLQGYLYQCRLALLCTLRKTKREPGLQVAIERFDDVSFDGEYSPAERIQTKHHISRSGSLSDKSTDLWKTLRIWAEELLKGELEPETTVLSLVTTSPAPLGSAASYLRPHDRDEVIALKLLIKAAEADKAAQDNIAGYAAFKALPTADLRRLVHSIFIFDAAPQISDVRRQIDEEVFYAVNPKHLAGFVDRLEGWWFRKIIVHLSKDSQFPILGQEVEAEIQYIRDQYQSENLTIDFFDALPTDGIDAKSDRRVFVEQLRLIAVADPRIADAIRDYYRAFQQRSLWLREDQLVVDELDRYEMRLIEEWRRFHDQLSEDLETNAEESYKVRMGKKLFNWMNFEADIPIRSKCREPYVQRGSFHMLADGRKVGWHPDFLERLQKVLTEASSK
jgi:hypothetical protein